MDRVVRSHLIRKAIALVLALVVGLTFVPLLGGNAYAADEDVDVYLDKPSTKDSHAIDITEPVVPEDSPLDVNADRNLERVEGTDALLADISDDNTAIMTALILNSALTAA